MTGRADGQDMLQNQLQYQQPEECSKENLQKPASSLQPSPANQRSPQCEVRLLSHAISLSANGGWDSCVEVNLFPQLSVRVEGGVRVNHRVSLRYPSLTGENLLMLPPPPSLSHCPHALHLSHSKHPAGNPIPPTTELHCIFILHTYCLPPAGRATVMQQSSITSS